MNNITSGEYQKYYKKMYKGKYRRNLMGKFKFIETEIEDLYIIEPTVFGDDRGYFMETYNYDEFKEAGLRYGVCTR